MPFAPSNKLRYVIFIFTVLVTIIATELIVQYNIDLQLSDAKIINKAGRQRMLSQLIAKKILTVNSVENQKVIDSIHTITAEFKNAQETLRSADVKLENAPKMEKLYDMAEEHFNTIVMAVRQLELHKNNSQLAQSKNEILVAEKPFLALMDQITLDYQLNAEKKLTRTKSIVLLLSCISILVLLGEFIFIIIPFFNTLKKQNKELIINNRRLTDFAHITSHNLRAPVSNLNSLLYIHDKSTDRAEKEEVIEKIQYVTDNLNVTMDTLITALKTQHDATKERTPIDLQKVLTKTTETLSELIHRSDATINADFSGLKSVRYNSLYMESIFLNLIGNSLKYQSPERSPVITIKSMLKKGKAQIVFSDNGLGIDLDKQGGKIFGLGKTFHKHPEARGVGLFMTRTQIESMGGTITVESAVNVGTILTITL